MSVFISDIDTVKLYVQFFRPLPQCPVSLKCWLIWMRLWVVAYESLTTKERFIWVIPKSGRSRLREWSLELVRSLNIRDFEIQWRGRRRERQKNNSFYKKNNNFARASRFFVHFFARFCTTITWKCLISSFMECVNKQRRNFISLSFPNSVW